MRPPDHQRPFRMTANLVRALRRYAHGRKGLDEETYRLHLNAVGARSTLQLTRVQHTNLLQRLASLPDRPARQGRASHAR